MLDRELAMFTSDLLGIQEVLLGKGVTEPTEGHMYLVCGKEMKIINYGQDFLYIRESYHMLNGLSFLVIGSNIYIYIYIYRREAIGVISFCEGVCIS